MRKKPAVCLGGDVCSPQVTEVQVRAASLCNNASYVLDDPQSHTLYVWHGGHTGMKEKTKVLEVSNTLRQNRGNLRVRDFIQAHTHACIRAHTDGHPQTHTYTHTHDMGGLDE